MKAEKLRLGNWVNPDFPMQVTGIYKDEILCNFEGDGSDPWDYDPNYLRGIYLTDEWFEKFGFKQDTNSNYWLNLQTHYLDMIFSGNDYYAIYCQIPEFNHEPEQRVGLKSIKYVHELQNLYYALTGKEL